MRNKKIWKKKRLAWNPKSKDAKTYSGVYVYALRTELLKRVIANCGTLVDEMRLVLTKKGWTFKVVDPAHVAMGEGALTKDHFTVMARVKKDVEVGLDLIKLRDACKGFPNSTRRAESVTNVTFDMDSFACFVSCGRYWHRLDLLDVSELADPKIPNLKLETFYTTAAELKDMLKGAVWEDYVRFETVGSEIVFTNGHVQSKLISENTSVITGDMYKYPLGLSCDKELASLYSLSYISMLIKTLSGTVQFELGTDYPLRMSMAEPFGWTVLLAPRIEGD